MCANQVYFNSFIDCHLTKQKCQQSKSCLLTYIVNWIYLQGVTIV